MDSSENFKRIARKGEEAYYEQDWVKAAQIFYKFLQNAREVGNVDRCQLATVMSNLAATYLQLQDYPAVVSWTAMALKQVSDLL